MWNMTYAFKFIISVGSRPFDTLFASHSYSWKPWRATTRKMTMKSHVPSQRMNLTVLNPAAKNRRNIEGYLTKKKQYDTTLYKRHQSPFKHLQAPVNVKLKRTPAFIRHLVLEIPRKSRYHSIYRTRGDMQKLFIVVYPHINNISSGYDIVRVFL